MIDTLTELSYKGQCATLPERDKQYTSENQNKVYPGALSRDTEASAH